MTIHAQDHSRIKIPSRVPLLRLLRARAADSGKLQGGFTLIEVLLVVALIGMVMLFVLPAFGNFNRAWRVRTAADEMLTRIRGVRQMAITKHQEIPVTFTPGTYSYNDPIKATTVSVTMPEGITMVTFPGTSYTPTFKINGSIEDPTLGTVAAPTSQYLYVESDITGARTDRYTFYFSPAGQVKYTVTR
jgi:prepilin-type N-terminal cleavage/methylation domain-containing protein